MQTKRTQLDSVCTNVPSVQASSSAENTPKVCPHKQSTEQSLHCLVSVLKNLSQPLTKDSILPPSHMEDECTLQVVPWFRSGAAQSLTLPWQRGMCRLPAPREQVPLSPSLVSQCLLSALALQAAPSAQQPGTVRAHGTPLGTGCELGRELRYRPGRDAHVPLNKSRGFLSSNICFPPTPVWQTPQLAAANRGTTG